MSLGPGFFGEVMRKRESEQTEQHDRERNKWVRGLSGAVLIMARDPSLRCGPLVVGPDGIILDRRSATPLSTF